MTAQEAAKWLNSLDADHAARPVRVFLGVKKKLVLQGALYNYNRVYQSTERAVTEGRVKADEKYSNPRFYLLGEKPKFRKVHHCFTWTPDEPLPFDERTEIHTNEWYTLGWGANGPFGPYFVVGEWMSMSYGPYEGHKIDTLDAYVYDRIPMTVEYLNA